MANANANYRSRINTDIGTDTRALSSRLVVNAKMGYQREQWSASVFGNNLFDEGYMQYRWSQDPNVILGAPRVVGLQFEYFW